MPTLRGEPGSRWTLPGSVDALADAARQAGRPGAIWLAGLAYQFVVVGWTFGIAIVVPLLGGHLPGAIEWSEGEPTLALGPVELEALPGVASLLGYVRGAGAGLALLSAPLFLLTFRLAAGLASLSPRDRWRAAAPGGRIRAAWREGRGLTLAAGGLWLQFVVMTFVATLVFFAPARLLARLVRVDDWALLATIFSGLLVLTMLVYGFLLSILFQIALHSLVQNRRGVGSALLHAWRIAKNDPMATWRAALVDAVLYFTILSLHAVLALLLFGTQVTAAILGLVVLPLLYGYAGCARCAFWARAYQSLGGLSTVTDAPGGGRG